MENGKEKKWQLLSYGFALRRVRIKEGEVREGEGGALLGQANSQHEDGQELRCIEDNREQVQRQGNGYVRTGPVLLVAEFTGEA